MSDCSPLRLAENGQSSPSQSTGSSNSQILSGGQSTTQQHNDNRRAQGQPRRHRSENDQRNSSDRARSSSEDSLKDNQLRYGARNVIELFIPVSLCMIIVVGTMKATDSYRYSSQTIIWYAQVMFTDQSVDTGTRVWQSLANAFIMLILIVVMTTVLILLYKFRCYATIHGWLILSSLILLFMFAIMYIAEILKVYNIPMDNYTLLIFIWNFGVVGMMCIHWKGPLLLQQGYLILISALLALVFIRSLPDWTTWTVLAIVSVWDLVAVLCPRGPLRILVETAQERNEAIFPALIYSSTMIWEIATTTIVATTPSMAMADTDNKRQADREDRPRKQGRKNRSKPNSASTSSTSSRPSTASSEKSQTTNVGTPTKRNQHPIDIIYEGAAQTPEVDIIQPTLSGTSDNWTRPTVRALIPRSAGSNEQNLTTRDRIASGEQQRSTPADHTIEFRPSEQQVVEERGVKLGLGDFIFFSLLVGKASSYGDWVITLSCYVAILVGLCLTLLLLAVFRKALPALPISIAFGLGSFFMSYVFAAPFSERLAISQVFI